MVQATPFTTKQVCTYSFKPVLDEQDEPTEHFRGQCGTVRKQDLKTGFSKLFNHVLKQHSDYAATMTNSGFGSGTLMTFIDQKSQTVYCWLDFVTECNLPFSFCKNPTVDNYTIMKRISTETLLKYAALVTKEIEKSIGDLFPVQFGIVTDGWSFHSEHYEAVFAVFEHDQRAEKVLLAMAPLVDGDAEDHTAKSHVAFFKGILPFFGRDISSIAYLVADNCSVNTRLAELLQVPFIGCASHRLNLAVNLFLSDFEPQLEQLQQLMKKLRCLNNVAHLRKTTNLRPVLRQATRWSSTYKMIERYFKLRGALDLSDDDIVSLMPTHRHENRLKSLLGELGDFQSATMKLQYDSVTLLDACDIFDALVEKHPVVSKYLDADALIVKDPEFEGACVMALADKVDELTEVQLLMLHPFETVPAAEPTSSIASNGRPQGFANKVLSAKKKQRTTRKQFGAVRIILATSNIVERLFSVAKDTLSHHRQGMLPIHLETILFLKLNRRYWSASTVAKVVHAP